MNDALAASNQINVSTPLFTLASDGPSSQYTVQIDGAFLPGVYTKYTTSTVCIKAPSLTDGLHTISAVELSPNAQNATPFAFTVDTIAPTSPTITNAVYSSNFVRVAGTGIPGTHISVRDQGAAGTGGSTVGSTGLWTCAYARPSGTHAIYAVQVDAAGNTSAPSNTVTVVVP